MDQPTATDRRSFLKAGAVVAAPLAAVAPVAALAGDGSAAKLARLEDERAIEALHRAFLRSLSSANDCGEFVSRTGSLDLGDGLTALSEDLRHEPVFQLAADGRSATARCTCQVEREVAFTGDTTLERMARFQDQGSHRYRVEQVLATDFVKDKDGWKIATARLA